MAAFSPTVAVYINGYGYPISFNTTNVSATTSTSYICNLHPFPVLSGQEQNMKPSLKIPGSVDYLDDEFGDEVAWNSVEPGAWVIVLHAGVFHFGQCSKNERLRNCYMLNLEVHEEMHKGSSHPFEVYGSYNRQNRYRSNHKETRWKRQATSQVWVWRKSEKVHRPDRLRRAEKMSRSFLGPEFNETAQRRKAYAAHRNVISESRKKVNDCFEVLGLSSLSATLNDLKLKRRELFRKWHPDMEIVFLKEGGNRAEFLEKSVEIKNALAEAEQYICRRENIIVPSRDD